MSRPGWISRGLYERLERKGVFDGPLDLGPMQARTVLLVGWATSIMREQFLFTGEWAIPDTRAMAIEILAGGGRGPLWFWGAAN